MSSKDLVLKVVGLWMVLSPICGLAQVRGRAEAAIPGVDAQGNAQTVEAALHLMADQAAIVFVGTVISIDRDPSSSGPVAIHFTVEQALRGCSTGTYTLREWAGLWTANDTRYRVGQRLLLLLHAPGASGLSTPVGGLDGAIPLRASGSGITARSATTASAEPVVDLRWIGARLFRPVTYRPSTPRTAPRAITNAPASIPAGLPGASVSESSAPAQESPITTVVAMIRSWQGAADVAR